jgi:hypothetical protein
MVDKFIFLTEKKKIKNPLFDPEKCDVYSYYGNLDNIDFEHQKTNYNNICDSLKEYNIKFNEIWYAKFRNSVNQIRSHFLVKSEDSRIFWHKYEALAPGGCQNKIYIDGIEYKTTKWLLEMSDLDRGNIINKD